VENATKDEGACHTEQEGEPEKSRLILMKRKGFAADISIDYLCLVGAVV
jgi:hypothetical protein